ncbi:ABC transporter A family member 2 [Linum grandiflorum]
MENNPGRPIPSDKKLLRAQVKSFRTPDEVDSWLLGNQMRCDAAAMSTMGLYDIAYWLSWIVWEEILVSISSLSLLLFGMMFQFAFFLKNSFLVVFLVFFLFQFNLNDIYIWLLATALLWFALAIYLDNIIPNVYGVRKSVFYFLNPCYWIGKGGKQMEVQMHGLAKTYPGTKKGGWCCCCCCSCKKSLPYHALRDALTGEEHLQLFASIKGLPPSKAQQVVEELLAKVKLTSEAKVTSKSYSRGMKRRLSVAIALIGDPKLLILDEPVWTFSTCIA